jgi:YlmC/YmxH family sporulation protein
MRLSQLVGKEIINFSDGARLGTLGEAQLMINRDSGDIDSIILSNGGVFKSRSRRRDLIIPWSAVRKVGEDLLIVDISQDIVD